MNNFKGIVTQLQESAGTELMFELLEATGQMVIELNTIKRKLEEHIENDDMPTAINELDLPEEFTSNLEQYNRILEDLQLAMVKG